MSTYDNSNNEITVEEQENCTDFWGQNPNILIESSHLYEIFPTETMDFNQQLNATTRLIIILCSIYFFLFGSKRILFIGVITIIFIYIIHYYSNYISENFENGYNTVTDELDVPYDITKDVFDEPTTSNPFSNVLITDYEYNPHKKPAPPSFNENINETIMNESKKMVQELNPDQPNIADKLFKDLGEQYTFEQSLRQFHSNPNTQIVNDQKSFAEFCYGSMVSCKEGNLFACARNKTNYNLY